MPTVIDPDDRPTVKPSTVAEVLGIGKSTALLLMSSGRLRSYHIGRYWHTTPRLLREYLERQATAGVDPPGP